MAVSEAGSGYKASTNLFQHDVHHHTQHEAYTPTHRLGCSLGFLGCLLCSDFCVMRSNGRYSFCDLWHSMTAVSRGGISTNRTTYRSFQVDLLLNQDICINSSLSGGCILDAHRGSLAKHDVSPHRTRKHPTQCTHHGSMLDSVSLQDVVSIVLPRRRPKLRSVPEQHLEWYVPVLDLGDRTRGVAEHKREDLQGM